MTRVKRGNIARKRRKKILKLAKGFRGSHSTLFRVAKQQVVKSLRYAYIGRKRKKRDFRSLWIVRLNAIAREYDLNYSQLIHKLKKQGIGLNRKMLSQLSILDEGAFAKIISLIS
uniref:Large ribosomal subunit protein bL20c n=1 Tax=Corynoplastis japonica TaxID=700918 RepID=A0A1X9PTS2_9RHOD|nr:50S ribosomal protein L20 [Corynoplastis japonica]